MNSWNAFTTGITRLLQYKRALVVAYLFNVLLVLVPGFYLASQIETSLGHSLAGNRLVEGYDALWYNQFSASAHGIASTFRPAVVGAGALFEALDNFISGRMFTTTGGTFYILVLYWLIWIFLSAGFINLYLLKTDHLLTGATRFFLRFLVLGIIGGVAYWLIFRYLFTWLTGVVSSLTHNTIDERIAFVYTLVKYLLLWTAIYLVNIIMDYSKVFIVKREYKNILRGIGDSMSFVSRHFGVVLSLYLLIGILWLAFAFIYKLIAPGVHQSTWVAVIIAFLVGQLYIFSRIAVRTLFYAGEAVLTTSSPDSDSRE